ncbi:MFS transporter [Ensifer sp. IC3342]|nr:MFS transporter [Ensifer sp. BRP08]MCA1451365.1 MFS transporter [Ensifer sp. IC3342]
MKLVPKSSQNAEENIAALLFNKAFRSLWIGSLVSNLGSLVEGVGAAWLMMCITRSDEMVALVQASTTLPVMIFSLVAGALADNFDRRQTMLAAQLLMFCVSAALAFLAYAGAVTPWMLLSLTFLIGCGWALHDPPWHASMGDIVPREHLPSAVALHSMSYNLMRGTGPVIGGIIVATAGAAFAFLFNVFCYFALIIALWRWKMEAAQKSLPRERFTSAIAAGFRYVLMSPNLLKVMYRSLVFGLTAVVILALLPLIARDQVEGTATTYGVMLGFFGLGGICGALLIGQIREFLSNEWVIRAAFFALAISCFFLVWSEHVWLSCLLLMSAGVAWVQALSLFNVAVQLSTPRWIVGRAVSLYQTVTFGGMAAGSWLWGELAQAKGVTCALLVGSLAITMGGLIGIFLPQPDFETLNLEPTNKFTEPVLRLDLQPRSGPISVTVDYCISQEDIAEFLSVMALRRRARLRDGAKQWALLRDLEEPHIWTESYYVATWLDYVRHNQRQTRADAEIVARLEALHGGDCPPKTHHKIERQTFPAQDDVLLKPLFDRT